MSGTTDLGAQIASLQASVEAYILPGLAADEAGVGVLADTVTQVVAVLTEIQGRLTVLEAAETTRVATALRVALHLPD